jgi:hypothetical protein
MLQFVSGLITMGYLVAGLFFLRFWTRTRDGLFLTFAVAFWLLAANQGFAAIAGNGVREERTWLYLLRLAAFALIIIAVAAKNWQARRR